MKSVKWAIFNILSVIAGVVDLVCMYFVDDLIYRIFAGCAGILTLAFVLILLIHVHEEYSRMKNESV